MLRTMTVGLISSQLLVTGLAIAADHKLSEIVVTEDRLITPTRQIDETVSTGSEISSKGMELQGPKAETSAYEAINLLPGLNMESADGKGLGVEQTTQRSRGVRGMLGALTVEGVPNYGGNPIGPRDYLYDLGNINTIAVYKGAVPADIGTGVGSRGGAIELRPDWPHEKFGAQLNQSAGTDNYYRTFLRLDSGKLPTVDTRLSGSYSYTQADKWRGPGELGPRHNFNLSLAQPITNKADIKLWYNYNSIKQDLYRALSFTETQNLDANYYKDYNAVLTGTAANDISYYKYNHGYFINRDFLSLITVTPTDQLRFTLKPYYSVEDTKVWQGNLTNNMVQKRTREIERTGLITEGSYGTKSLKGILGYHYEASTMDIYMQNYAPTTAGLSYRGYAAFATAGTSAINSPYLKLTGSAGKVDWQVGLKYFNYAEPSSDGYRTQTPLAAPYPLVRDSWLDRSARTYDILLPTAGISCTINDSLQAYTSYGRNFIRPYSYLPLVSTYVNGANIARFKAANITLNSLFDGYKMEESDNFDLGLRYKSEKFEIAPTLFFGLHKNLLTTISDTRVTGIPISYQQNIGKATGYGLDLEMNAFVTDYLTIILNPTWTSLTYDDDMIYQGTRYASKGKQVVDTPEWMLKSGIILKLGDFEISPKVRVIGERYGDVAHQEKIDPYAVADLSINYTKKKVLSMAQLKVSLELTNLTDEHYVAVINSSDDTRAGSTSYYQGAPFSAIGSVAVTF
ncbi:MAG: TonB-dependent receptor [Trichlorobacter sp.]|uniref:TonB-dependent receptor n=1 Tax=Trichlorobacter sp. TaxID=2911007 RepID=UPI0025695318|nr:TonB-dependent receptor [Trichlorobacter sp.]MDK9718345.1 TonB-dependent receptor [Trichlorobacter sp.]